MTITNIGELQAATEAWMERTFTDALFLEFANATAEKIQNGVLAPDGRTWLSPPMRLRSMLTTGTIVTTSGVGTIPASVLEFERLWINATDGSGIDLLYLPLAQFRTHPDSVLTGSPTKYTIDGASLYIAPTSDATIQESHFTKLGGFDADGDTDAVLTNHPRLYLAGCITEACGFIGDYERENREDAKFMAAVRGAQVADVRARQSGSIKIMRPQSVA